MRGTRERGRKEGGSRRGWKVEDGRWRGGTLWNILEHLGARWVRFAAGAEGKDAKEPWRREVGFVLRIWECAEHCGTFWSIGEAGGGFVLHGRDWRCWGGRGVMGGGIVLAVAREGAEGASAWGRGVDGCMAPSPFAA